MKTETLKPNSHPDSSSKEVVGVVPQPLDNVVAKPLTGSILAMETGLFYLGRNRALESETTEPRLEDVRTLEDHARAMAGVVAPLLYDGLRWMTHWLTSAVCAWRSFVPAAKARSLIRGGRY